MGWLDNLLSEETSDKQKQKAIEWQKDRGVTGNYKKRYDFTWEQQQWLAPGYLTKHTIQGKFDCGLNGNNRQSGEQVWSVEMRDLSFDWNEHAVPETYFLAAFPWRMDIKISKEGLFLSGDTWVDYRDAWKMRYKKSIIEHIADKKRAEEFYQSLAYGGNKADHTLSLSLLKNNPLVIALCHMVYLNYRINNQENEERGEFGEQFTSELVKPDYFYEDIHLPLKTTWLRSDVVNPDQEAWSRVGGPDEEKYQDGELMRLLRKVTGIFNLRVNDLYVDYSELYHVEKIRDDFRQLLYAEQYLETMINQAWMKSERLEMKTDEKGVVYV